MIFYLLVRYIITDDMVVITGLPSPIVINYFCQFGYTNFISTNYRCQILRLWTKFIWGDRDDGDCGDDGGGDDCRDAKYCVSTFPRPVTFPRSLLVLAISIIPWIWLGSSVNKDCPAFIFIGCFFTSCTSEWFLFCCLYCVVQ